MNHQNNGLSPRYIIVALVVIAIAFSLMSISVGLNTDWIEAKGEAMKDTLPAMIRAN